MECNANSVKYVNLWSQIYTNLRASNWFLYKQIKSFHLLTRGFLFQSVTNLLFWRQPLPFFPVKDMGLEWRL